MMMQSPHVFLINLDRDAARLASVSGRLRAAGIEFERIAGVNGVQVPGFFSADFGQAISASLMSHGEIGCYASHLLAAKQVVDRGLDCAVVVEDDTGYADGAAAVIAAAAGSAPDGWDVISLCARSRRAMLKVADLPAGHSVVRYSRYPWDVAGYIISRSGAQKLLAHGVRTVPFDLQMRQPWSVGLNSFGVHPSIVYQIEAASSIDTMGGPARTVRRAPTSLAGRLWYARTLGFGGLIRCAAANVFDKAPKGAAGPVV